MIQLELVLPKESVITKSGVIQLFCDKLLWVEHKTDSARWQCGFVRHDSPDLQLLSILAVWTLQVHLQVFGS